LLDWLDKVERVESSRVESSQVEFEPYSAVYTVINATVHNAVLNVGYGTGL